MCDKVKASLHCRVIARRIEYDVESIAGCEFTYRLTDLSFSFKGADLGKGGSSLGPLAIVIEHRNLSSGCACEQHDAKSDWAGSHD